MNVEQAYSRCRELAAAHYENFPVASRLVPPRMRPHVAAVYAFARAADDLADEGSAPAEQRLAWLDEWRSLCRSESGAVHRAGRVGHVPPADVHAIFLATHATIARCGLDPRLFDDLLSAFAQDVTTTRYDSWADVLDYCRRSANPVGRLVLGIAGVRSEATARWSDAVCTALQLTNFWQDLGDDWRRRDRLYVPVELMREYGARPDLLESGAADDAWRRVMGALGVRTQALFDEGRPVCDAVRGRLRYELRATWLGGTAVLRKVRDVRQRSLQERPVLTRSDLARIAIRSVWWTRA